MDLEAPPRPNVECHSLSPPVVPVLAPVFVRAFRFRVLPVGEFDRVGQQVEQHLQQPGGVPNHAPRDSGVDVGRQLDGRRMRVGGLTMEEREYSS